MDELTRELNGKLKLEDVPESDPKSQSDPTPQQRDSGGTYHFSGLDAEVTTEGGAAVSEMPDEQASQRFNVMESLSKDMDRKLKLGGGVAASSKGPRPPGEASSIPETEASSSPQKPQQIFSFIFDEGNLRTPVGSERSTGNQALNPSAPVWTPTAHVEAQSPSTTKEHSLPLRLREGPSTLKLSTDARDSIHDAFSSHGLVNFEAQQKTSASEDTLKRDPEVRRSVGNERHTGTEMQIKATSCDTRAVNAKDDRKSQTLCRNVVIYGHCRYEELGCGFQHP